MTEEVEVRVDRLVVGEVVEVSWDGDGWAICPRPNVIPSEFRHFVPAADINDTGTALSLSAELVTLIHRWQAQAAVTGEAWKDIEAFMCTPRSVNGCLL